MRVTQIMDSKVSRIAKFLTSAQFIFIIQTLGAGKILNYCGMPSKAALVTAAVAIFILHRRNKKLADQIARSYDPQFQYLMTQNRSLAEQSNL